MLINLNSIETVILVRDSVEQACNEEMEMELLVNKGQVHTRLTTPINNSHDSLLRNDGST